MALRAYDAEQTFDWESEDFPGVKCKLRPLTAREFAECQEGEKFALLALEVARRGLVSAEGVENPDGSARKVKLNTRVSKRGVVPGEFFDGLPSDFYVQICAAVMERSQLDEDDEGNS